MQRRNINVYDKDNDRNYDKVDRLIPSFASTCDISPAFIPSSRPQSCSLLSPEGAVTSGESPDHPQACRCPVCHVARVPLLIAT